jgi:predicted transcriptional regulator
MGRDEHNCHHPITAGLTGQGNHRTSEAFSPSPASPDVSGGNPVGGLMASDPETAELTTNDMLRLSTDIVASYVTRNAVGVSAVSDVLRQVFGALSQLGQAEAPAAPAQRQKPAVPIAKSIQHDHIVCLEDGKKLKMLKRYLRSRFGLSPEEYRRRWGLPADYPMVAPAYAERRSAFAKEIGLGRGVRRRGTT